MLKAKSQTGVVLLVALVFLLILTVAGISAIRLSSVEERMTANFADRNIAFQSAEAALSVAEQWIKGQNFQETNFFSNCNLGSKCFNSECTNGLCFDGTYSSLDPTNCLVNSTKSAAQELYQKADIWVDNSGKHIVSATDIDDAGALAPAKYIIEFICYAVKDPLTVTDSGFLDGVRYDSTYWEPMYRITALGTGRNPNTRIMLQSTYRRD